MNGENNEGSQGSRDAILAGNFLTGVSSNNLNEVSNANTENKRLFNRQSERGQVKELKSVLMRRLGMISAHLGTAF